MELRQIGQSKVSVGASEPGHPNAAEGAPSCAHPAATMRRCIEPRRRGAATWPPGSGTAIRIVMRGGGREDEGEEEGGCLQNAWNAMEG